MKRPQILLIFIDGLGIGEADPQRNPLIIYPDLWPTQKRPPENPKLRYAHLDACLGIPGLPQSATGQTALLTGVNAPRLIGKHLQGFPSVRLIEMIHQKSIFVQLRDNNLRATFANAYRRPEDLTPTSRLSVTSHALRASGQPFRSVQQIARGEALYHDFTNLQLIQKGFKAPLFTPQEAAAVLANLAVRHDFTLYEHFLTDVVAHQGERTEIQRRLDDLTVFLREILKLIDVKKTLLIITSDHGNIEDLSVKTHTTNPVPLLWCGAIPDAVEPLPTNIAEVCGWVLRLLGSRGES